MEKIDVIERAANRLLQHNVAEDSYVLLLCIAVPVSN